tara:strand:- start:10 stop:714 length:705 start_codon:yes stop_codon:yes gene_type:complete
MSIKEKKVATAVAKTLPNTNWVGMTQDQQIDQAVLSFKAIEDVKVAAANFKKVQPSKRLNSLVKYLRKQKIKLNPVQWKMVDTGELKKNNDKKTKRAGILPLDHQQVTMNGSTFSQKLALRLNEFYSISTVETYMSKFRKAVNVGGAVTLGKAKKKAPAKKVEFETSESGAVSHLNLSIPSNMKGGIEAMCKSLNNQLNDCKANIPNEETGKYDDFLDLIIVLQDAIIDKVPVE